jgi:MFS family permease
MQLLSRELKKGKNIIAIVLLMILLIIPFHSHVYHMSLYYIIIVFVFIPLAFYRIIKSDSFEKRFYFKWKKKREKGRFTNMISEGLRTMIFIVVIVFGSQFIVNGYTPSFILSELPINVSMGLMFFLFILGAIAGVAAWGENEKRYQKIYLDSAD